MSTLTPIFERAILRQMPHPIASAWAQVRASRGGPAHVSQLKGCFDVTLRLLVAFLLPDYLRGSRAEAVEDAITGLHRPSLGHYARLILETLRALSTRPQAELFFLEAPTWAFDERGKLTDAARTMDTLVSMRNSDAHEGARSDVETASFAHEFEEILGRFLASARWMCGYRICRVREPHPTAQLRFQGHIQAFYGTESVGHTEPGEWSAWLLDTDLYVASPDGRRLLHVTPFLSLREDPRMGKERIFLLISAPNARWLDLRNDESGSKVSRVLPEIRQRGLGFEEWLERRQEITWINENDVARSFANPDWLGVGRMIDQRYEVLETLGRGGMATVYLVNDTALREERALKLMNVGTCGDQRLRARLARETSIMRRLGEHEHILAADEFRDLDDGRAYLLMPVARGGSLKERLETKALAAEQVLDIARQALSAIVFAHENGVIHRDVKPSNMLLDEDGARLLLADFGVARDIDARSELTMTSDRLGSLPYMAPEAKRGKAVPESDLYSLGVSLHQLATGEIPDSSFGADLPEPLRSLVRTLCDPNPEARRDFAPFLAEPDKTAPGGAEEAPVPRPPTITAKPDAGDPLDLWARYLEDKPGDREAHGSYLDRLEHEGRFDSIAEHLGKMAKLEDAGYDDTERAALRLRQAEVLTDRLGRAADAAEILESLIASRPADEAALRLLEQVYRTLDEPQKLAHVLVRRVDAAQDTSAAVDLLREVAEIYSDRLDNHENALYAWLDALNRSPENGDLVEHALREAREIGSFEELLAIGTDSLADLDPLRREERVLRLVDVAEHEASDPERALELLGTVTSEEEPSVALLERQADLYERLERHTDLAAALGALVEAQDEPLLKRPPLRRLAKLQEEVLEDIGGAIDAFETLVALEPGDLPSLRTLERLYKGSDRTEDLVRTQERLLDADPQRHVALLKSIGRLCLEQLDDADRAAEALEQASVAEPQDPEIHELLETAHATREDWAALANTYERWASAVAEPGARAGAWRKLAILREEAGGDNEGAADAYFQALLADPSDAEALASLERLHRQAGRLGEIVHLYLNLESRTQDSQRRVELLQHAVSVFEGINDPDDALRTLEGVLDLRPNDEQILDLWLELVARLEQTTHKADVLHGHLPKISDPAVKRRVAVELGRVLFFDLADAPRALEAIENALDPLDETPEVLELRADLFEATDQIEGMQAVFDALLARTTPGPDRAEVMRRMARLAERNGEEDEAIDLYEQASEEDPSNEGILEDLAALYLGQGMVAYAAEPLLGALARKRERRSAPGPELAAAYSLQGDAASRRRDDYRALEHYERALDVEPENMRTRLRVGELALTVGKLNLALKSLQAVVSSGKGAELPEMGRAHRGLGEIALVNDDLARAREHLIEVISLDPHNEQVIEDLVTLSLQYEDYEGALDDLRTLAGLKSNALERYDILLRMAEIARYGAQDTDRAESLLQEAVSVYVEGRSARIELLKLYNAEERFDDTVRGLEELAGIEEDTKKKTDYLISAAQVCKNNLDDPVRAVDMFDRVLDLDPSRVDAFALIDATLTEQRDWHTQEREYRKMLDRVRDLPGTEHIQFKLYSGLGEIYRSRLGDMRCAADAFTIARDLKPDHVETHSILADIFNHLDDHKGVLKELRAVARLKPDDGDALLTLYKVALTAGEDDIARIAAQIMVVLRRAPAEVKRHYKEVRRPLMVQARGHLDLSGWKKHLIPPGPTSVMGEVFAILYRALSGSLVAKELRDVGVKKRDAIEPDGKCMLTSVLRHSARLLGLDMVKVYRRSRPVGISVEPTMPPCIVVGSDMLGGRAESELAYLLARHLALLMPMHALGALYGAGRLERILLATQLFLDPNTQDQGSVEALQEIAKAISAHIAPADAERLRRLMPAVKEAQQEGALQQYLDDVDRAATRAGLLVADNLAVAAKSISAGEGTVLSSQLKGAQIRDLVAWMLSDDYLEARRAIGASLPNAP